MALEIGLIGKVMVEGSNLSAHRGLKSCLFCERKFKVYGCSTFCACVSSIVACWNVICDMGLNFKLLVCMVRSAVESVFL